MHAGGSYQRMISTPVMLTTHQTIVAIALRSSLHSRSGDSNSSKEHNREERTHFDSCGDIQGLKGRLTCSLHAGC